VTIKNSDYTVPPLPGKRIQRNIWTLWCWPASPSQPQLLFLTPPSYIAFPGLLPPMLTFSAYSRS
jgi:hypothetical protein